MELEPRQRRDLLALLCRVAWADGLVVDAERTRLRDTLSRVGQGAVTEAELEQWLSKGPPKVRGSLPIEAKQLFIQEAMRVISADCDIAPAEMASMRDVINYYFTRIDELLVG